MWRCKSQVTAWSWGPDLLHFRDQLDVRDDFQLWAALWRCLSAWLEGAQVNGVSGGEAEQSSVIEVTRRGFGDGAEKDVFTSAFRTLRAVLGDLQGENGMVMEKLRILAKNTDVLAAALRLWVACTPPLSYTTSRLESLVPPTVIAEFTDIYNTLHAFTKTQPPHLSPITTTLQRASVTRLYLPSTNYSPTVLEYVTSTSCFFHPVHIGMTLTTMADQHSYTADFSARSSQTQ